MIAYPNPVKLRRLRHGLVLAGSVCATAMSGAPALAAVQHFDGHFEAEHGATNHPEGVARATFNPKTNELHYTLRDKGLSGPITAIHLHGPADPGTDGGVLQPVPGPYTGVVHGRFKLTPDQAKALEDGKTYFNLHTAAHPDGEARAQLTASGK